MSNKNEQSEFTKIVQQKMVSACCGSILTSLILTPMDVIRIRLQQQEMISPCSCTQTSAVGTRVPAIQDTSRLFWQSQCFENINCLPQSARFRGSFDAFLKISEREGTKTLWRGLSLNLIMAIPANVVYFTGYEYLRDSSYLRESWPTVNPLLCGAFARVIAATCIAPLELIKTKLQSIPRTNKSISTWTLIKDIGLETRCEIQCAGVFRSLFKGLSVTLWRDVPFSAIYWTSYELFSKGSIPTSDHSKIDSVYAKFASSFFAGLASGSLAAVVTHPFDVGKTRMQISAQPKANSISGVTLPNSTNSVPTLFEFLSRIRRTEGTRALYTGLPARMAKIAPSCAIMISTYEASKLLLG